MLPLLLPPRFFLSYIEKTPDAVLGQSVLPYEHCDFIPHNNLFQSDCQILYAILTALFFVQILFGFKPK